MEPPPKRSAFSDEFAEAGEGNEGEEANEDDDVMVGQYEGAGESSGDEAGFFNEEDEAEAYEGE